MLRLACAVLAVGALAARARAEDAPTVALVLIPTASSEHARSIAPPMTQALEAAGRTVVPVTAQQMVAASCGTDVRECAGSLSIALGASGVLFVAVDRDGEELVMVATYVEGGSERRGLRRLGEDPTEAELAETAQSLVEEVATPSRIPIVPIVLLAAAGASAFGSIVLFVGSIGAHQEFVEAPTTTVPEVDAALQAKESAEIQRGLAIGLAALTAGLVAAGVALFVLAGSEPRSSDLAVVPVLWNGGTGIIVAGRWP